MRTSGRPLNVRWLVKGSYKSPISRKNIWKPTRRIMTSFNLDRQWSCKEVFRDSSLSSLASCFSCQESVDGAACPFLTTVGETIYTCSSVLARKVGNEPVSAMSTVMSGRKRLWCLGNGAGGGWWFTSLLHVKQNITTNFAENLKKDFTWRLTVIGDVTQHVNANTWRTA